VPVIGHMDVPDDGNKMAPSSDVITAKFVGHPDNTLHIIQCVCLPSNLSSLIIC
jgi:hypothetical protein